MRLKDTMQGIKMAQLNFYVHAVFFIVMQFIVTVPSSAGLNEINKDKYIDSLNAFWIMRICHVLMFICLVFSMFLKAKGYDNASSLLVVITTPLFYIWPVLKLVYTFKMQGGTQFMLDTEMWGQSLNPVLIWNFLEISYFFMWVLALALFCLFAYCEKYKSILKTDFDDEIASKDTNQDIWNNKNSDDFLRYFKWEAFNFSHYLCQMLMALLVLYFSISRFGATILLDGALLFLCF